MSGSPQMVEHREILPWPRGNPVSEHGGPGRPAAFMDPVALTCLPFFPNQVRMGSVPGSQGDWFCQSLRP